ncbi:MAG: hypothetical protein EOP83_21415 [Verrucomicrobiaceae bacterium]|nr:MAG: hypothetical protein EOP83_21415 [Verrucomicrobiaceae bacterium]
MYVQATPRRPWRGSTASCWVPDKMVSPCYRPEGVRQNGNCPVIYRNARTKQRRLDKHLTRFENGEWDE